jgi:broad-specificity NMP kinase
VRVAITGGPSTGKTTLAGSGAKHTDDLIEDHDWSAASEVASTWFDDPSVDLHVEGVAVPRALRKWLLAHPEGKPVEKLIVLQKAYEPLNIRQQAMAKGVETVLAEIHGELEKRGVRIVRQ